MRILYAEDEKSLSMAITEILKMEQYDVDAVYDGREAIEHLAKGGYDAVVLDIMMPLADGLDVLRTMRQNGDYTPVLLLTAKAEVDDRIAGLTAGADDYLGKPFSAGELMARLEAMIRRTTRYHATVFRAGGVTLDTETGELKTACASLRLSGKETRLLSMLMQNKTRGISAKALCEAVWQDENADAQLTLYLTYLRDKLAGLHANVRIEKYEAGYRLTGE